MAYLGTPGTSRGTVTYDEQGRPYLTVQGRRRYVSPVGMGDTGPEDRAGFFHRAPQWNSEEAKWETPFDWGHLLALGAAGGIGLGALSANGVFGGAGGAAAAPAVTDSEFIGPTLSGPALTGSEFIGPTASAAAPAARGAVPGGPGRAAEAGLTGRQRLVRGGVLTGLAGLGAALGGGSDEMSPELRRLLAQQLARQQAQNPLYESILRLAYHRLPVASRAGLTPPSLQEATAQTPALGPGGSHEPPELRQLFQNTELRQRMSDPLQQALTALAQRRLPRG